LGGEKGILPGNQGFRVFEGFDELEEPVEGNIRPVLPLRFRTLDKHGPHSSAPGSDEIIDKIPHHDTILRRHMYLFRRRPEGFGSRLHGGFVTAPDHRGKGEAGPFGGKGNGVHAVSGNDAPGDIFPFEPFDKLPGTLDGHRRFCARHFHVIDVFPELFSKRRRKGFHRLEKGDEFSVEIFGPYGCKVQPCFGKDTVPVEDEPFRKGRVPERRGDAFRHECASFFAQDRGEVAAPRPCICLPRNVVS
jgi:hypothetical protein